MTTTTMHIAQAVTTVPDPDAQLRALVLEQALRCCPEPQCAAAFVTGAPGTVQARADVGRFMAEHRLVPFLHGSPLAAWAAGTQVDPGWRFAFPGRGSAWETLGLHLAVMAPTCTDLVTAICGADHTSTH